MTKEQMKTKVKQAYFDRTGKIMSDADSGLIDICQGIIEELIANTEITVTGVTTGGSNATGSITA